MNKKNLGLEILSEITVFNKYAKFLPQENRRETWEEIVDRYEGMLITKYPQLTEEIKQNVTFIREKKVLPSMRALQFAGKPIELNNTRLYNCCFLPIDHYKGFSELMFLLLSGTGVGYSVQFADIEKLPEIRKPLKEKRYLIGDSIEGWADAIKILMKSYFTGQPKPRFDFRDIRPKGARLVTAGGKAPGPEPLKLALVQIESILNNKQDGEKLTSLECHDICCFIANSVLAGGIRRAAMIALFSFDDEEMLSCKSGSWWELNEQRGRANNSAVIVRNRVKESEFKLLWKKIEASKAGEPGISWTNNAKWGFNPCHEVSLRPFQYCNLCEINASDIKDQEELNIRSKVAAFFGTLQAGFTDFHYLRDVWKKTTEKDALIGVGMTGVASKAVLGLNLVEAAEVVKVKNEEVAKQIGINKAARTTVMKPSGTTSCVLGTSSGIHAWHNDYFFRRQRLGKNESLYNYLYIYHPELLEDDFFRPLTQAIVKIPCKAPEDSILRTESVFDLLERVKKFNLEWVKTGHRSGDNVNNVSATISIKDDEWDAVGEWMWKNKESYSGISVLNYDNGTYVQAPFTDCTKEEYEESLLLIKDGVNLTKVVEMTDETDLAGEAACSGNGCELVI